ncbi:MAG TPA: flagellar hook-length control protein FliK [Clostridia bacterium]|nr:flagellar hook-length control protein FliK [Clostridia bacterium]
MNLYELMSGNLQAAQGSSVFQFNAQPERNTSGSRDTSSFGAILGTKLNGSERKADINPAKNAASMKKLTADDGSRAESSRTESSRTESKLRYMTFQEANANVRKIKAEDTHAASESTATEPEGAEETSDGESKKNTEIDVQSSFINICAELLGIDKGELQKLLDQAGITAESLKDTDGIQKASAGLSQLLGLNSKQAESLKELFAMLSESLGILESKQVNGTVDAEASGVNKAEVPLTTDTRNISTRSDVRQTEQESGDISVNKSFLDKLAAQIGAKLDEISLQADKTNSSVEEELKNLMRPLLEKAEINSKAVSKEGTQKADTVEIKTTVADTAVQTKEEASSGKNTEKESTETDDGSKSETDGKTPQKSAVAEHVQTVKAVPAQIQFQNVQENRQVVAAASAKTPEAPLRPSELITQIVEKAKVVLSPDKSEMVMDLKPDSLGKLSLKVVTENGIVMAKFIADNQQVREILESNMQLLKDSLEKQGMSVQGFSVSVRQDQRGSDTNRPQYGSSGNMSARAVRNANVLEGQTVGIFEANTSRNPYRRENSTIDLTA